ncbi:MAG: VWA domain-containing protein [Rhodospirillales bacterium]|nr:VWA domain-containing protein [Rhodospirillales bacterium]
MNEKLPTKSSRAEVEAFLEKVRRMPQVRTEGRGRLVFAMDATASRAPTWDRACRIQGEMFEATAALGGLEIQLVYYRGFAECKASRWLTSASELHAAMSSVSCVGGQTQIERVLNHIAKEARAKKVNAAVFVGDAMEESHDRLAHLAGELGLLGVPVFVFHEGGDPVAARAFQDIARLSKGAYCPFDSGSAQQLKELLGAVAAYAAGGRPALESYAGRRGGAALLLTHRLGK